MDAISSFLGGARARGAFLLRAVMEPPWSVSIEDEAPLSVVVMLQGDAWVSRTGREPQQLRPGQVMLVSGPEHYVFADDPATAPQIRILPGEECVAVSGEPVATSMGLGIRTWGNTSDGATQLLIGTYLAHGEISRLLTAALPPVLTVGSAPERSPLLLMLAAEMGRDLPGQQVVLDRLLDLLVIDTVRAWFEQSATQSPAWYAAHSDPVVGPALRLLHAEPQHPWTVAELARRVGISRAALARKFTDVLGQPPMAYLTDWRLATAADLLLEPSATVGAVARQVGYTSPFTFSTAFKRAHGHSPRDHRKVALV